MAKVEHVNTWSRSSNSPCRQSLGNADRLADLRLENTPVFGKEIGSPPTAGGANWITPTRNLPPGIVGFAVIEIGGKDGAVLKFPGPVRDHGQASPVVEFNLQSGEELGMLSVKVSLPLAVQVTAVPAVAQDGSDPVGAGLKEFGDIGREDLNALPVVRPAGHEEIATDFLTVEVKFSNAEGSPVQGGFPNRTRKRERFPEKRAGLFSGGFPFPVPDPLCALERHRFLNSGRREAGNQHLVPLRVCFHRWHVILRIPKT